MAGNSQLLAGKSVLVTGAARGLGAAIARASVAHGAAVVVLADVLADALMETVDALGPPARGVELDVTDPGAWQRLAADLRGNLGRPDVLVNNAGVVKQVPLEETTDEEFMRHLGVNLFGPFLGIRTYVELHRATECDRRGSIVNVASSRGLRSGWGVAAYASSKFGVRGLTKVAALELGELGIRVNAVCPGPIATDMSHTFGADFQSYVARLPLRRMGQPIDIAEAVCWLGSDVSGFVTGIDLPVDGGLTSVALGPHPRAS